MISTLFLSCHHLSKIYFGLFFSKYAKKKKVKKEKRICKKKKQKKKAKKHPVPKFLQVKSSTQ